MYYKQDWLMRQIEAIAAVIAYVLTGKKSISEDKIEAPDRTQAGQLYDRLLELTACGDICGAENALFAAIDENSIPADAVLETAMRFYSGLNALTDSELEARDFSREEILSGIRDVCAAYDVPVDRLF